MTEQSLARATGRHAIPVPHRMKSLPRNKVGYVVPWFVDTPVEGQDWDFRVMDGHKLAAAIQFKLCWVCGQPTGRYVTFVSGPMCGINRTSAEPPSHYDCALYSVMVCPFLSVPKMVRRENGLPEQTYTAGLMITRNPGVAMLWTCVDYQPFQVPGQPQGMVGGVLFEMGEPERVEWFAEGREATRAEVETSVETGLPALRELADAQDAGPMLDEYVARFQPLLPA